ncbi:hypothetical protein L9F63_007002, partial [Diploptera punctata]
PTAFLRESIGGLYRCDSVYRNRVDHEKKDFLSYLMIETSMNSYTKFLPEVVVPLNKIFIEFAVRKKRVNMGQHR